MRIPVTLCALSALLFTGCSCEPEKTGFDIGAGRMLPEFPPLKAEAQTKDETRLVRVVIATVPGRHNLLRAGTAYENKSLPDFCRKLVTTYPGTTFKILPVVHAEERKPAVAKNGAWLLEDNGAKTRLGSMVEVTTITRDDKGSVDLDLKFHDGEIVRWITTPAADGSVALTPVASDHGVETKITTYVGAFAIVGGLAHDETTSLALVEVGTPDPFDAGKLRAELPPLAPIPKDASKRYTISLSHVSCAAADEPTIAKAIAAATGDDPAAAYRDASFARFALTGAPVLNISQGAPANVEIGATPGSSMRFTVIAGVPRPNGDVPVRIRYRSGRAGFEKLDGERDLVLTPGKPVLLGERYDSVVAPKNVLNPLVMHVVPGADWETDFLRVELKPAK